MRSLFYMMRSHLLILVWDSLIYHKKATGGSCWDSPLSTICYSRSFTYPVVPLCSFALPFHKLIHCILIKRSKVTPESPENLLTIISNIDDLNYPEKTQTYYIVNAPYVFSTCWKVVKPLLQERTRRKVQVLQGCGRDELLKIMDYASLPHFCKSEGPGSSRYSTSGTDDCFSLDHPFHQQLYSYIQQQASRPIKQGSFHVEVPVTDPEDEKIVQTIESEFHKIGNSNGLIRSVSGLKVDSA